MKLFLQLISTQKKFDTFITWVALSAIIPGVAMSLVLAVLILRR